MFFYKKIFIFIDKADRLGIRSHLLKLTKGVAEIVAPFPPYKSQQTVLR